VSLDAQGERRRICSIREQRSENARPNWNVVHAGREDGSCNKTEQHRLENKASKRIHHADTQGNNNQRVLGVVSSLDRVIPAVEHFNDRADKAGNENQPYDD
jgi:hypothetical protein